MRKAGQQRAACSTSKMRSEAARRRATHAHPLDARGRGGAARRRDCGRAALVAHACCACSRRWRSRRCSCSRCCARSGVSLNLFHLIALILAAGLGLDYALFFEHASADRAEQRRTLHAVLVCSLSTLMVFALLGALGCAGAACDRRDGDARRGLQLRLRAAADASVAGCREMRNVPISSLIPHQGAMCLLERVVEWDERRVVLETATHRSPSNPLRVERPLAGAASVRVRRAGDGRARRRCAGPSRASNRSRACWCRCARSSSRATTSTICRRRPASRSGVSASGRGESAVQLPGHARRRRCWRKGVLRSFWLGTETSERSSAGARLSRPETQIPGASSAWQLAS